MGRLSGKVAFITGAAVGMGRSHAIRFAEEGADVIALDIGRDIASNPYPLGTPSDLDETAAAVEALGRRIVARTADVRDQEAIRDVVDEGVATLGGIDVVAVNAGITSSGAAWELTEEQWSDTIDVNLSGAWRTAKAVIPTMIAQGRGGSITITSSTGGAKGFPGHAHYTSSKHGTIGLMRTLANELAPHWIRVNAVLPTSVDTPMIQNEAMYRSFLPDTPHPTRDQVVEHWSGINALPVPWVEPVDVSNAVLFLASDEGRYITGVALPVDAGFLNKA